MPALLWLVKEVDVMPSIAYTSGEFGEAVAAVAVGAVDEVIARARHTTLAEAAQAIAELSTPDGPVKVLVDPTS